MSSPLDRAEWEKLFTRVREGTLSESEQAKLEGILRENAEARRLWFLHCDLETGLADWASAQQAERAHFSPPALPAKVTPGPWVRLRRWALPLAAAIAVSVAGWLQFAKKPADVSPGTLEVSASGIAVLTRAPGVAWEDNAERTAGTMLAAGTLKLRSGAAQVDFFSGARVILEGPAEFRLISTNEGFLQSGKIHAHVPPQARGFTVGTPSGRIVDYGTDFGVSLAPDAAPEVHVFTGRVEVTAPQHPPRALGEGEAVRINSGAMESIPAKRTLFLAEEELARRDAAYSLQRLQSWQESARLFRQDPATRVFYTFSPDDAPERMIANQVPGAAPETHGSVIGSAWTDGRWPGKRAMDFRGESDRVRFTAPLLQQSVTLLAWVRVKSLPRWQNVLLASDSHEPGALRWHVTQRGELRLEIARDLGRPHSDWEAVNSQPFLTPDRFGPWVFLATTFDGQTVAHYGNGEPIGSGASYTPPQIIVGQAELGNWRGETQRHFTGAMDEFVLLSRVLSPDEIRALYRAGRP